MKKVIKMHYKILIGLIIGILISATAVYASQTVLSGNEVTYDNTKSHGTSNDVQGSIDELYKKLQRYTTCEDSNCNIIAAYKYDETNCITGEEETCERTDCYKTKTSDSCKNGDIIKYKVNDETVVTFNVMFDNGKTLTLQSQKNIVNNIVWNSKLEGYTEGPITILTELESKTNSWLNVNDLKYSIGNNSSSLGYSGCKHIDSDYTYSCNETTYTLEKDNVKARMLTVQEATKLGCEAVENSCPKWMYSNTKLPNSNIYLGYWTMSTYTADNRSPILSVAVSGGIWQYNIDNTTFFGARAVVEINK